MNMDARTKLRIGFTVLILLAVGIPLIVWTKEIAATAPPLRWAIGMTFSLVIGAFTTWGFLTWLRAHLNLGENPLERESHGTRPVPPLLTGGMERLFFTTIVGLGISGAPIAMMGWLTLKMVSNWNRPGIDPKDARPVRGAFSALLAGLVSMLFAGIGGVICRGSVGP